MKSRATRLSASAARSGNEHRRWSLGLWTLLGGLLVCISSGCVGPRAAGLTREREIEAAADALLEMQPDANWTVCYNRLLSFGRPSLDYVASRPAMQQRAAPDDLRVMLHTSLLRLLAGSEGTPALSVSCFETTLDVLHFELKVHGRRVGEVVMPTPQPPRAWHDLYPTRFDHELAAAVDLEGDRRALLHWWQDRRAEPGALLARRPLRPRSTHLWPVLSRRYADLWTHDLNSSVILCGQSPTETMLFNGTTYDYNLVRAACIWLATSERPDAEGKLIELVGHPSRIVAYNARFALRHSPDPRIRDLIERYNEPVSPATGPGPRQAAAGAGLVDGNNCVTLAFSRTCGEQWSATHEMDQVYSCLRVRDLSGESHRRPVWRR